jgi:hypothetical protein
MSRRVSMISFRLLPVALFLLAASVSHPGFAEFVELSASATSTCQPEKQRLVVRYFPSLTEAQVRKLKPVVFFRLLKLGKDGATVTGTRSSSFDCRLGADRYTVTLSPGVPNPNLNGRCGAAITGLLSVKRNDSALLSELEFEPLDCHSRQRYVSSVIFRPGVEKPEITYADNEEE